jgi:hypothetical protein
MIAGTQHPEMLWFCATVALSSMAKRRGRHVGFHWLGGQKIPRLDAGTVPLAAAACDIEADQREQGADQDRSSDVRRMLT